MIFFLFRKFQILITLLVLTESYLLYHHNYASRLSNLTTEYLQLSPLANILDVGAYNGQWTKMLRSEGLLIDGISIMIDGNRKFFNSPSDSRDIRISELVGDIDGKEVQYYRVKSQEEGNSLFREPTWFFKDAEIESRIAYTIDTLLQSINKEFTSFDLIYLDISGSELKALKGAVQTLSRVTSGVIIVKVASRKFSKSLGPSFLDIQMELYQQDFVIISILQYYYVTKSSGEKLLTHMDVAWQRREYVKWLGEETWEERDYWGSGEMPSS